jgi:hypothetical protein
VKIVENFFSKLERMRCDNNKFTKKCVSNIKGTNLEGDPRDSKYWYQKLTEESNNRSESSLENLGELYNRNI